MYLMHMIADYLRYHPWIIWFRLNCYSFRENIRLARHLASSGNRRRKSKFEADLTIRCHAIEKGLALPAPRPGFGERKVGELLQLLQHHYEQFGDAETVASYLSVLNPYFDFQATHGHLNTILTKRYEALWAAIGKSKAGYLSGGVVSLTKQAVLQHACIDFGRFAACRHSIRDFAPGKVAKEDICRALEIARKAPSACNRQSWQVYVFTGKTKNALLQWQGGNRGFTASIDTAILITSDLNRFFINERHQVYVDGGLYAMSLLYALHAQGLGTIPLTTGKKDKEIRQLYSGFRIPPNEVPVLIIGVGCLKDTFSVARSERKTFDAYTRFIAD